MLLLFLLVSFASDCYHSASPMIHLFRFQFLHLDSLTWPVVGEKNTQVFSKEGSVGPGAKVFCPECIAKDETSADHVTFQILALLLRAGYCLLAPFATFMACLFAKDVCCLKMTNHIPNRHASKPEKYLFEQNY